MNSTVDHSKREFLKKASTGLVGLLGGSTMLGLIGCSHEKVSNYFITDGSIPVKGGGSVQILPYSKEIYQVELHLKETHPLYDKIGPARTVHVDKKGTVIYISTPKGAIKKGMAGTSDAFDENQTLTDEILERVKEYKDGFFGTGGGELELDITRGYK